MALRKATQAIAALGADTSPGFGNVQGQESTPVSTGPVAPQIGTENQTRGEGGEMNADNFGFNPCEYHYWNNANWNNVEE